MKTKLFPMGITLISLAMMLVLHFFLPLRALIPSPWNLIGIIPLACGITINLTADKAFRTAGTTVKPFEESAALVTGGVYRISRNPMYLGFVLVLIGIAVLLGSLTPWFIVSLFAVLMDRVFITVEERMLEARFGGTWQAYKLKTRRWI